MADPYKIETAVSRIYDQTSFIQELLIDALGWPIDEHTREIEEITYKWSAEELRAEGLEKKFVDGVARQIVLPRNPWGIFILEFKNPDVFVTGRGITSTLRKVLRGLVPKKRATKDPSLASFNRENLLFICNHDYKHYRFAHFKAPKEDSNTAPLAAFGWGPGDSIRQSPHCRIGVPARTVTADCHPPWTSSGHATHHLGALFGAITAGDRRKHNRCETKDGRKYAQPDPACTHQSLHSHFPHLFALLDRLRCHGPPHCTGLVVADLGPISFSASPDGTALL